jgi:hypothetical protein
MFTSVSTMTITFAPLTATDLIAWVGALTGVAALFWALFTWRRANHKIIVRRSQAWLTYPDGNLSADLVSVEARNTGLGAVTITSWGIEMGRSGQNMVVVNPIVGSTPLPHRLEPGAAMTMFVEAEALIHARDSRSIPLRKMKAWVSLATGQKVHAKRGVPVSVG